MKCIYTPCFHYVETTACFFYCTQPPF
uniref:Uncharacterized protein n=1 Tax=Anguilla anguilla TaxID=7936 RepID=A0A0E9RII2_ANGAN